MRKFVIVVTAGVVNILVAMVVAPMAATSIIYAQDTSNIQAVNFTNTSNATISIKKLNASIIINAINAEIRSVYNDDGKYANSVTGTITELNHEQIKG